MLLTFIYFWRPNWFCFCDLKVKRTKAISWSQSKTLINLLTKPYAFLMCASLISDHISINLCIYTTSHNMCPQTFSIFMMMLTSFSSHCTRIHWQTTTARLRPRSDAFSDLPEQSWQLSLKTRAFTYASLSALKMKKSFLIKSLATNFVTLNQLR